MKEAEENAWSQSSTVVDGSLNASHPSPEWKPEVSRTVLFFDPSKAGHRLQSVLAYARCLHAYPNIRIVFAVHEWVAENALSILGKRLPPNATFAPVERRHADLVSQDKRDVRGALRGISLAERLAQQHGASEVYFMHLDTYWLALALRILWPSKVTYSGLLYKVALHYQHIFGDHLSRTEQLRNTGKAMLLNQLLRSPNVSIVHSLDCYAPEMFETQRLKGKLVGVRDGASPPPETREPADTPPNWLLKDLRFLLFGAISARKGIFQLLDALRQLGEENIDGGSFLICGVIDEACRSDFDAAMKALKNANPRIVVETIDRYLADEELWWLIQKSSVIMAPYQRHVGSSGVLRWAAAAQKPIVTQDFGLVGWETRVWHLGIALDTSDPSAIADGIRRFLVGDGSAWGDAGSQRDFAQQHSEEAFASDVISTLANPDARCQVVPSRKLVGATGTTRAGRH